MDARVDASHLDADALRDLVGRIRQGDVLDVAKVTSLFSPDSPSFPEDAERAHEEPVMTVERRSSSGLAAIISQTCDLRRLPSIEPYIVLAPLRTVEPEAYREAKDGLSVRHFAIGTVRGHEDKGKLVIDARLLCSIEKVALLSPHVERIDCPLSNAERDSLREWLGRRLGRPVFPEEISDGVVVPIEQAFKRVRKKEDAGGLFRSVVWVGVSWTEGKRYASLLLLLDPTLRAAHGVRREHLDIILTRLRKALDHFSAKAGAGYTILADAHDATNRPATDILSYQELSLDLDSFAL